MKIKIGWRKYKVIEKDDPELDGEFVNGFIDTDNLVIQLDKNLPKKTKQQVLIHEVVHGVLKNAGKQELFKNEELVDCIASGIMQVIYDNERNIFEKVGG